MNLCYSRLLGMLAAGIVALSTIEGRAETIPTPLVSDITVRKVLSVNAPNQNVRRLATDPRDNTLYLAKANGEIWRINVTTGKSVLAWDTSTYGVVALHGFDIGPDGTVYVVGNENIPGSLTRATFVKGVEDPATGNRTWSTIAQTVPYPRSATPFDHRFNGIVVSLAGTHILVSSGSRTDHGEIRSSGGLFPGQREVGLTAFIARIPVKAHDLVLQNDRAWLGQHNYVYAEGTRNTFDLAYAPNGDLFGTENSCTSDIPDELNWIRRDRHYGYPWRMGGLDNPQQFSTYDPLKDKLLNATFDTITEGKWENDPTFPPRPSITLTEPIKNLGPDADSIRRLSDGAILDANDVGRTIRTFTAHRSPLGLVFDREKVLRADYRGDGFMLSWTTGDPVGDSVDGPFADPSQDLVHLDLTKTSGVYTVRTTRIVGDFNNPIDAELIGNRLYVLDYGGSQSLWEITLPQ